MAFGISVYPEHATCEQNLAYVRRAGARGFKRVFSCLLSVERDRAAIVGEFTALDDAIHEAGMEVILDVAPSVFDRLGISYDDLSFFAEVHADGIRLDEPFRGSDVAAMTRNPQGLKIELNASSADGTLAAALANGARRTSLLACHNFYPQRYSGLDWGFFERESRAVRAEGVRLAAFVSCGDPDAFGPWPLREGLPTLERHRGLPMDLQARQLAYSGLVDDIIISNCFPTDAELDALQTIDPSRIMFRAELEGDPSPVEREILFEFPHRVRGDLSSYILRSTMSRVAYRDASIPPRNARELHRGDVVIVNDTDARYKGELQIVLRDMPSDGKRNVVARLGGGEGDLMPYLDSWTSFGFLR